jgi:hypothetical protein
VFDDDREDQYDEFKRRQDDDRSNVSDEPKLRRISPINRPAFEDRDSPQKDVGISRSRYETPLNDRQDGQKSKGQPNRDSPLFNRSSFAGKQDKQDIDKRVRTPTKVYVTNGPIFMNDDKRPQSSGDERSFGPEGQQHIDVDYDDRFAKDPYDQNFARPKGPSDRDRPPRPIQRQPKPTQASDPKLLDEKPYLPGRDPFQGMLSFFNTS